MPELLLELFSEEIPARMQPQAAADLERLVCAGLREAGLEFSDARSFATPRRLTLVVDGLPETSPDVTEERKGPRVGAAEKAVEGFLRAAGLKSIDDAEVVCDEKKGDFYVARIARPGRPTADVIAAVAPDAIRRFPWPKSMRWGSGKLRWVRPLHSILCLLGGETVAFEVDGIASGNETSGHRFMGPERFGVKGFADYEQKLRDHSVILDAAERRRIILDGARAAAEHESLELVEDEGLLGENAGLTEWPVVLMGAFDEAFLQVPPEVIVTAIRKHQKCFSVRKGKKLANRFILVANLEAEDGGAAIVAGNERVIRARLSDAKFFWDQDRKVRLEDRLPALQGVIFHDKLGTQAERVERLKRLARELAPLVGADPDKAERAAELCKADLVTDMVVEFPDLQGLIGKYYALAQGEDEAVARAIEEHYRPQGPHDAVPTDPVSIAVALADKLDTLVGFWAIDEKPTGSKDPYALRRAALGVIRIILENKLRADLTHIIVNHCDRFPGHDWATTTFDLIEFLGDRLKVQLRDQGARYDLVDAVFQTGMRREQMMPGMGNVRDLLMIVRRVEALGRFLDSEDGANLLIGVKRAINILRIEEKKDERPFDDPPDPKLFELTEEKALAKAIDEAAAAGQAAVEREDFEAAMRAIVRLCGPVDAFFDHVTVNADDARLRENRLKLLNRIREATLAVADFSKIAR